MFTAFWNTCKTLRSKCNCYDGSNFPGIPLPHRFESSVRFVNLRGCPAQAQEERRALRVSRAQARSHPGDNGPGAPPGGVTAGPRVRTRSSVTLGPAASAAPPAGAPDEAVPAGCIPPSPRRCPRKPRGRAGAGPGRRTHLFGAVLALHLRRGRRSPALARLPRGPGRRGCGTGESGPGDETRTSSARCQHGPRCPPSRSRPPVPAALCCRARPAGRSRGGGGPAALTCPAIPSPGITPQTPPAPGAAGGTQRARRRRGADSGGRAPPQGRCPRSTALAPHGEQSPHRRTPGSSEPPAPR